ncbi:TIGR01906 family membrane protein [Clostridium rectalis]|uniref:TIGR01906 family membrane protein n=1 Tax=Clostridium rectalis TaxID=2040295 RepID=UPI000F643D77|nr:TIGR01906 family membrane protein [Clostridium rectalis]
MTKEPILNNLLLSLIFSIFFILISIKITVNFKPLYYFDIHYLNIPQQSNLNIHEIKANYNYLIDFLTSNKNLDFNLPTLPSSVEGKIHFYEVKTIFKTINYLTYISSLFFILGTYKCVKKKNFKVFKYTFTILLLVPFMLIIPFCINFQTIFHLFHKITFENNYWLFDINKDPIIKMLPEKFFFHNSILIAIFILIFSIFSLIIYKKTATS